MLLQSILTFQFCISSDKMYFSSQMLHISINTPHRASEVIVEKNSLRCLYPRAVTHTHSGSSQGHIRVFADCTTP